MASIRPLKEGSTSWLPRPWLRRPPRRSKVRRRLPCSLLWDQSSAAAPTVSTRRWEICQYYFMWLLLSMWWFQVTNLALLRYYPFVTANKFHIKTNRKLILQTSTMLPTCDTFFLENFVIVVGRRLFVTIGLFEYQCWPFCLFFNVWPVETITSLQTGKGGG